MLNVIESLRVWQVSSKIIEEIIYENAKKEGQKSEICILRFVLNFQ